MLQILGGRRSAQKAMSLFWEMCTQRKRQNIKFGPWHKIDQQPSRQSGSHVFDNINTAICPHAERLQSFPGHCHSTALHWSPLLFQLGRNHSVSFHRTNYLWSQVNGGTKSGLWRKQENRFEERKSLGTWLMFADRSIQSTVVIVPKASWEGSLFRLSPNGKEKRHFLFERRKKNGDNFGLTSKVVKGLDFWVWHFICKDVGVGY